MFDDKTQDVIMDEMLDQADPEKDTRPGSIIYDAIGPMAAELEQVYADMSLIEDECFADTASYYYLIKRAAERGIFVKEGTPTVLKIKIVPADLEIPIGSEFNIGEHNYTVTEKLSDGYYAITCSEAGTEGNEVKDEIIPMYGDGDIEEVTFDSILVSGTDDEDEEALRERYFDSFNEVAFGGNRKEYQEKADSFQAVGGCKVIPVWNGGGTVKLVITGADHNVPSAATVADIQEAFDPAQDGTGVGLAPIGHVVTVAAAAEQTVNISCGLVYQSGYAWDDVKDSVSSAVENYFLELRKTWEDDTETIIRVGHVESILLAINGISDVSSVMLNGTAGNFTVDTYKIPKVGDISG